MFIVCQNYKVWGLLGFNGSNNDHITWYGINSAEREARWKKT